jgi:hypothetical protein
MSGGISIIEGLWIVQFHGSQGVGGGVVVLTANRVLGGDSAYVYSGVYELKGSAFQAKVFVKNFDPAIGNVLGIPGDFQLLIDAKLQGDEITGTGALAKAPDSKIVVRLKKETDLT